MGGDLWLIVCKNNNELRCEKKTRFVKLLIFPKEAQKFSGAGIAVVDECDEDQSTGLPVNCELVRCRRYACARNVHARAHIALVRCEGRAGGSSRLSMPRWAGDFLPACVRRAFPRSLGT